MHKHTNPYSFQEQAWGRVWTSGGFRAVSVVKDPKAFFTKDLLKAFCYNPSVMAKTPLRATWPVDFTMTGLLRLGPQVGV
jgi:hypothetical protein